MGSLLFFASSFVAVCLIRQTFMESLIAINRAFPFPATMWSRVLRTRGGEDEGTTRKALEDLCTTYRPAVTGYLRALDCPEHEVEDVTQEFFITFLRRDGFQRAEPERGRLRAYLKSAIRHHLYHWRRDRAAAYRGGGVEPLELDADEAPELPELADAHYDEEWALIVLERALGELKDGYVKRGRLDLYERLKPTLLTDESGDIAALTERLGMSRGALAVEQHRARRRLAELLRAEVAETVNDPAEVESELLHLLRSLAHQ